MFLKLALLCSVLSCARAAPTSTDVVPLEKQQPTVIPIVSQSEELESNGTFKFSYETGNGIKREEISYEKVIPKARSAGSEEGGETDESSEIHVQQGSYSYVAPDGTVISLKYIADENGFRPVGDHIPRAPVLVPGGEKSGRALNLDTKKAESANVSPASSESEPAVETPKEVANQAASAPAPVVPEEPVPEKNKASTSPAAAEDTKAEPKAAASAESAVAPEAPSKTTASEALTTTTETASSTTTVSSAEVSSSAETASTTAVAADSKVEPKVSPAKINSEEKSVSSEVSTESASPTTSSS